MGRPKLRADRLLLALTIALGLLPCGRTLATPAGRDIWIDPLTIWPSSGNGREARLVRERGPSMYLLWMGGLYRSESYSEAQRLNLSRFEEDITSFSVTRGLHPSGNDVFLVAAKGSELRRSLDGGSNWIALSNAPKGQIDGIASHPSDLNLAYVLVAGRLWRTTDGGMSWGLVGAPCRASYCTWGTGTEPAFYLVGEAIGATHARAVFVTRDRCTTWSEVSRDVPRVKVPRVTGIAVNLFEDVSESADGTGTVYVTGTNGAYSRTGDGAWTAHPEYTPDGSSGWSVRAAGDSMIVFCNSLDEGSQVVQVVGGRVAKVALLPGHVVQLAATPDVIVAQTANGAVWYMSCAMAAFAALNYGVCPNAYVDAYADLATYDGTALASIVGYSWLGFTGGEGVFKTVDGGRTWKKVVNYPEHTFGDRGQTHFAFSPRNPWHIWCWNDGRWSHWRFISTDGGDTWREVKSVRVSNAYFTGCSFSPVDPTKWYMLEGVNEMELMVSSDEGRTWNNLSQTWGGDYDANFVVGKSGELAVGAKNVLRVSRDGGWTWSKTQMSQYYDSKQSMYGAGAVPLAIDDNHLMVALSDDRDGGLALLATADGGRTWSISKDFNRAEWKVRLIMHHTEWYDGKPTGWIQVQYDHSWEKGLRSQQFWAWKDWGATWVKLPWPYLSGNDSRYCWMATAPEDSSLIAVSLGDPQFVSRDGGLTLQRFLPLFTACPPSWAPAAAVAETLKYGTTLFGAKTPGVSLGEIVVEAPPECEVAVISDKEAAFGRYGWWSVWHSKRVLRDLRQGGRCTFDNLLPGTYTVVVYKPGAQASGGTGVKSDGVVIKDVLIEPGRLKTIPVKPGDFTAWNCLSCPWVHVFADDRYVRISEILRDQVGSESRAVDVVRIDAGLLAGQDRLRLRIAEEKDEVTHLQSLEVLIDGVRLEAIARPRVTGGARLFTDGSGVMTRDSALDWEYRLPRGFSATSVVEVRGLGYYEPVPEAIRELDRKVSRTWCESR